MLRIDEQTHPLWVRPQQRDIYGPLPCTPKDGIKLLPIRKINCHTTSTPCAPLDKGHKTYAEELRAKAYNGRSSGVVILKRSKT